MLQPRSKRRGKNKMSRFPARQIEKRDFVHLHGDFACFQMKSKQTFFTVLRPDSLDMRCYATPQALKLPHHIYKIWNNPNRAPMTSRASPLITFLDLSDQLCVCVSNQPHGVYVWVPLCVYRAPNLGSSCLAKHCFQWCNDVMKQSLGCQRVHMLNHINYAGLYGSNCWH